MVKDEYLITIEREQKPMLKEMFTSLDRMNGKQEGLQKDSIQIV